MVQHFPLAELLVTVIMHSCCFVLDKLSVFLPAGKSGIARHVICKRLGVSMKRMKKQLDEIALRFGVIETNEQNGKLVGLLAALHRMEPSRLMHWCSCMSTLDLESSITSGRKVALSRFHAPSA